MADFLMIKKRNKFLVETLSRRHLVEVTEADYCSVELVGHRDL